MAHEPGQTAHRERRAGPVCPAAGRHVPVSAGRWIPPRRAGACPRRRDAPANIQIVGAGILDGPGWGALWARQGCRALRWGVQKGRRPPPADGVGTAALRHTPRRLRHLRMAPWTIGDFAPCAARVFRWLRPAGISPVATGGSFAPCAGRPGALPQDSAILGCPPPVGKSDRRGIFRQSKVWVRSHTGCMARNRTAAMAEKARRAPQTHGWRVALSEKNRVKLLSFVLNKMAFRYEYPAPGRTYPSTWARQRAV